jgi:hypothetical protein
MPKVLGEIDRLQDVFGAASNYTYFISDLRLVYTI